MGVFDPSLLVLAQFFHTFAEPLLLAADITVRAGTYRETPH